MGLPNLSYKNWYGRLISDAFTEKLQSLPKFFFSQYSLHGLQKATDRLVSRAETECRTKKSDMLASFPCFLHFQTECRGNKRTTTISSLCITILRSNYRLNNHWDNELPNFMELSPSWEAASCATQTLPNSLRTRRFITVFTIPIHWSLSWARSIQSIPPHPYLRSILILPTHHLGLPNGLFPSGSPTNILYAFLFYAIRATLSNKCVPTGILRFI
jgi:hypothetical protein